jgi:hypothetical protein
MKQWINPNTGPQQKSAWTLSNDPKFRWGQAADFVGTMQPRPISKAGKKHNLAYDAMLTGRDCSFTVPSPTLSVVQWVGCAQGVTSILLPSYPLVN